MIPGVPENRFALVVPTLDEAGNIDKVLSELTECIERDAI